MKCTVCVRKGLRSRVYAEMGTVTAMYFPPYYDEDGVFHHHDRNMHTQEYHCSNRHRWLVKSVGRCPSCDFGKGADQVVELADLPPEPERVHLDFVGAGYTVTAVDAVTDAVRVWSGKEDA